MLTIEEIRVLNKDKIKGNIIYLKAIIEKDEIYFQAYNSSDFSLINFKSIKTNNKDHDYALICLNDRNDIDKTLDKIFNLLISNYKLENIEIFDIDVVSKVFEKVAVDSLLQKLQLNSFNIA